MSEGQVITFEVTRITGGWKITMEAAGMSKLEAYCAKEKQIPQRMKELADLIEW